VSAVARGDEIFRSATRLCNPPLQPAKEHPRCRATSQSNPSELGFSRRCLACAVDIAGVSVPFTVIVAILSATTAVRSNDAVASLL
jgi:hypothetical protein